MDALTDRELTELKHAAEQTRPLSRALRWVLRVTGRTELDAAHWIPVLVSEIQRLRVRSAQLEGDCAQLQREYDRLRYGSAPPAA
jgi:hypothetical protein